MMGPSLLSNGTYSEDVEEDLETPPIKQTVTSFYMGRYEVTTFQWCKIMEEDFDEKDALLPKPIYRFPNAKLFAILFII